jgi:hypothetical protein
MKVYILSKLILVSILSLNIIPASAFGIREIDNLHVSDANWCGDFSQLTTYELYLAPNEFLPAPISALYTRENLRRIETQLRTKFYVPANMDRLVIMSEGEQAGTALAQFLGEDAEYCFRTDFRSLFGFTFENKKFTADSKRNVSFLEASFVSDTGFLSYMKYYIVIDRNDKKLYLLQMW